MTQKAHESMSVNSKSMSKISDNASDGSFNNQFINKKRKPKFTIHRFGDRVTPTFAAADDAAVSASRC